MADPQTANLLVYQPSRGSDPGVWDSPVNANTGVMDSMSSNVSVIPLTGGVPVTLSLPPNSGASWVGPYQSQSAVLRFTSSGTLSAAVTVTLPRPGFWIVENLCTVGAFYVALASSAPGNIICAPPGEAVHVYCDGVNVKYVNLDRVGSYMDLAASAVPAWISNCTVKPYLNCDGSPFSAVTYPNLAALLGGTTLPDARGRMRAALNQGTGRISASVNGDILSNGGGLDTTTMVRGNIPNFNLVITEPNSGTGHQHSVPIVQGAGLGGAGAAIAAAGGNTLTTFSTTGIIVSMQTTPFSITPMNTLPPVMIGGLTLIRSG